ncbi:MAG: glycosyltransferase family 39 protein [Candidatus Eisenbacteria bacterium]
MIASVPGSVSRPRIDRSHLLIALALLVAALVPRLMIAHRAIWFDERFTMMNTTSVSQAIAFCVKDVHPPLYFILVAAWRMVLPSTEFSLRVFSLIFGIASLVGIFLVARSIAGRRAGIAAFLVGALSPYHWLFSTELRPYAMFLAFSAFSTWAFLRLLKTGERRYFLIVAVLSALNLYTHYFAVFLVAVQILVFLITVLRNSVSGAWAPGYRNRQFILGLLALGLVAIAYAPWAGAMRRIITESVFEGKVVGIGKRIGRGVTLDLVRKTVYRSLGWGIVPCCLQGVLVLWGFVDRKLRGAALVFATVWTVPFLMLLLWRPAHFIDPKYFLFAYPITVALVAGGLGAATRFLTARGMGSNLTYLVLVLAVSASPLLPGQHPAYAFHQADWRDVVAETERYMKEGDRIHFSGDSKIHAMFIYYMRADFFGHHPLIILPAGAGERRFEPFASGSDVWLLQSGSPAELRFPALQGRAEHVKTWDLYPASVHLYHWVPRTR